LINFLGLMITFSLADCVQTILLLTDSACGDFCSEHSLALVWLLVSYSHCNSLLYFLSNKTRRKISELLY